MKMIRDVSRSDWENVLNQLEFEFISSSNFEKLRLLDMIMRTFFQLNSKVLCKYHSRDLTIRTNSLRESLSISRSLSELLSSTSINPEFWNITALSNGVWIVLLYIDDLEN